ncbi:acyl-CoA dehydrogenase family protein, partial [Acinetobacter baumannii]|nr:acyl-CoA dehydrogenase family protein [Acinetobacter baumannii]
QENAFDEYGLPQRQAVDKSALDEAEHSFLSYLKTYPQGEYAPSARGLLRRVHWLAGDASKLADDYAWQLTEASDAERKHAHELLDLLTPIVKSWPSEFCLKANELAIQILGGHGYTREYPVEQYYRDNRLNPIHEG